jgi:tetratricopeptide (TPR) repeat protein
LLVQLATAEDISGLQVPTAIELSYALQSAGAEKQAEALLRRLQGQHPDDFWVNHWLAYYLDLQSPRSEEALRFYTAAVALRPQSPGARLNLDVVLGHRGKWGEAIAAYREAIRIKKNYAEAHLNLGDTLTDKVLLDEATAECRKPEKPRGPQQSRRRFDRQGLAGRGHR